MLVHTPKHTIKELKLQCMFPVTLPIWWCTHTIHFVLQQYCTTCNLIISIRWHFHVQHYTIHMSKAYTGIWSNSCCHVCTTSFTSPSSLHTESVQSINLNLSFPKAQNLDKMRYSIDLKFCKSIDRTLDSIGSCSFLLRMCKILKHEKRKIFVWCQKIPKSTRGKLWNEQIQPNLPDFTLFGEYFWLVRIWPDLIICKLFWSRLWWISRIDQNWAQFW